jgi:hypothetical protein
MRTSAFITTLTFTAISALSTRAFAQDSEDTASVEEDSKPKKPKRGDFDAGGNVRLPSGPDEMGEFATFNWIALDLGGRYFLLDSVTVGSSIPLAVKKPDTFMDQDPKLFGGISVTLEAKLPKMPFQPKAYKGEVGLKLGASYMRAGAPLLSEKDFPLFTGGFEPGFTAGLITKIQLSSLVDFSLDPDFVFQSGSEQNLTAVQIPMSLILRLGSLAAVSADTGVFTGDDFSFGGDSGGRISLGAALDLKLGPIILHTGAGFASLLTGGLYPEIGDSVYIDLNVKYAK